MHILTELEEKELLKNRIAQIKKQTQRFIKEHGLINQVYPFVFRMFLLAENYNAKTLIPYEDIQKQQDDLFQLEAIVRSFRQNLRIYDNDINHIVKKGGEIRRSYQPIYPDFFQKKDRLYLKISPVSSGVLYLKELIDKINQSFPLEEKLSVAETVFSFFIQTEKDRQCKKNIIGTKAGRFLKKQADYASQILTRLSFYTQNADEYVRFINSLETYQDYINCYKKFKNRSTVSVPRALLTPTLFYALKSDGEIDSFEDLKNKLELVRSFYLKHYQNFHLMQAVHQGNQQSSETIDMLIISKNPFDIAKMSAYAEYSKNEWGSCMLPRGINSHYLPDEIGRGVFVVYGINSKNPARKLSRISVKPYINENGDVYFGTGFMYGLMMPEVKKELEKFLSDYQPKLRGVFELEKKVYHDAVANTYYFNMDVYDILTHQKLRYYKGVDGYYAVGNYKRQKMSIMSGDMITILDAFFDIRPKVEVSTDGIDKDVSFSNMDIYGVFGCYYFTKSKAYILPHHTDELLLISSNIQNLKGIDSRYFTLSMHLSDKLKSLEGLSTWCSDVSLTRMNFNTSVFKTPQQVRNLKCGITTFKVDHLDLSDVSNEIEIGESDLSGVKKLTFPKKAKNVNLVFTKMPKHISLDISGLDNFYFAPLEPVVLDSLQLSEKLKKCTLLNVEFGDMDVLDLSHLEYVSLAYVSLEKVSKLILPDEKKVSIASTCKLPYGMKPDDVVKRGGYGFRVGENNVTRTKITQNAVNQSLVGLLTNASFRGRCC